MKRSGSEKRVGGGGGRWSPPAPGPLAHRPVATHPSSKPPPAHGNLGNPEVPPNLLSPSTISQHASIPPSAPILELSTDLCRLLHQTGGIFVGNDVTIVSSFAPFWSFLKKDPLPRLGK